MGFWILELASESRDNIKYDQAVFGVSLCWILKREMLNYRIKQNSPTREGSLWVDCSIPSMCEYDRRINHREGKIIPK